MRQFRHRNSIAAKTKVPIIAMLAALVLGSSGSLAAWAQNFALAGDVIGALDLTTTARKDTIADIARTYSMGYREMRLANPKVDPWLPGEDTEVVIPSLYILPDAPRVGLVINVPEMRIYYFPKAARGEATQVATYPVSIGRQDWSTPHGVTQVVSKIKNPSWTPPETIRKEHASEGDFLPKVVGPGPDNPLGAYALRLGLVINVPEMRIYYFPKAARGQASQVATYPVSIGRQDWSTPHGVTQIVAKIKDPSWAPPETIRQEHASEGDFLPKVVGPGPDNPLGAYALRLGLPGYLIHGTDKPYGIGMRVTHGCMRLYPHDIDTVYHTVPVGTQVRLVNEPFKIGLAHGEIYLEVHPYLDEDEDKFREKFTLVVNLITKRCANSEVRLNWQALRQALYQPTGIPVVVGSAVDKATTADRAPQLPHARS